MLTRIILAVCAFALGTIAGWYRCRNATLKDVQELVVDGVNLQMQVERAAKIIDAVAPEAFAEAYNKVVEQEGAELLEQYEEGAGE